MEITTKKEILVHKNIIKAYVLMVGGKEVRVEKWWTESMNGDYENDYRVENGKEVEEVLGEDVWEQLKDFITNLK